MIQRKFRTSGVVPASISPVYDSQNDRTVRNGGAVWDADRKAWKCTTWVSNPEQYRVVYDDGSVQISKDKPVIESIETPESPDKPEEPEVKKPQVKSVEAIPAYWELENKYISPDEVPEWEQYRTREAYYVDVQPQVNQVTLAQQGGPDRLIRESMKYKARAGQLR